MDAAPVNVAACHHEAWSVPGAVAPTADADAERFLNALAIEQQRYVAEVGALGGSLAGHDLAALAAGHVRLAREFCDAQRAILRRRAETQAHVAAIVAAGRPALPPPTPDGWIDLPAPAVRGGVRPHVVSDAILAELVDAAFEDPTAVAERELRTLLDGWWQRECEEGRARVADARVCAAAAHHLGSPEPTADEDLELPAGVTEALDGTESLDQLLDTLLRVLDHGPIMVTAPAEPVNRDAEHFERFWRGGPAVTNRGSVGNWLLVQVLLPMVSLISVLALVLAVTG